MAKLAKWISMEQWRQIYFEFLCCLLFYIVLFTIFFNLVLLDNITALILLLPISTGVILFIFIRLFGALSGAHINPIFTMVITLQRLMPVCQGLCYVLIQFSTSVLACLFVTFLYRESFPGKSYAQVAQVLVLHKSGGTTVELAVEMEFLLTFILVYVALSILLGRLPKRSPERAKELPKDDMEAPTAESKLLETSSAAAALEKMNKEAREFKNSMHISMLITVLIWMGGASSAAIFNPARAFAPALVSGDWRDQWIYWTGEVFGGLFGLIAYKYCYADAVA